MVAQGVLLHNLAGSVAGRVAGWVASRAKLLLNLCHSWVLGICNFNATAHFCMISNFNVRKICYKRFQCLRLRQKPVLSIVCTSNVDSKCLLSFCNSTCSVALIFCNILQLQQTSLAMAAASGASQKPDRTLAHLTVGTGSVFFV